MDQNETTPVTGKILVVDDVPALRRLVGDMLKEKGHQVASAGSGEEALALARSKPLDLIMLDITMPDMDGYEVCRRLKQDERTSAIPVIFISALGETFEKVRAFSVGGIDYITKPFQVEEVLARVQNHLTMQSLRQELLTTNSELERRVDERTSALQNNVEKLQQTLDSTILAMAKIVEIRDPYTAGHQHRVAQLAQAIAQAMGLDSHCITGCHMSGLIHDIGKIYVPAEILSKPGRLTKHEFALLKTHTTIDADIVKMIDFPWPVMQIVLQHHERLDGSGYPQGLKGEEILLEARLMGVADVVEAMSSHRPYRAALGIDRALAEIETNIGNHYDADAANACLSLFRQHGFHFDSVF